MVGRAHPTGNWRLALSLIEHAAEQFTDYSGDTVIPPETIVDRIFKDTEYLSELQTWANKPAPVFKRGGEIAYVVEYRGGQHFSPRGL